ncbi:RagB/SusD family nutrient uptake outer membrane protein [Chryseobacterium sp. ERMR1:04]|uniref:RagB/SusD family nutrient uptake outer membrane protein n=1 Tax=Chryseobacterium sp. ERMR1:04 TaxID=1705393 RepID=UPI0006C83E95|nr:RagB/SusD family nutrient uptake outer membrane protein [Chryseobacterium sp. ERMR1:04]KPH11451.1 glycan metabolism protein [Chryseobacterium sp. ERMR1:04]
MKNKILKVALLSIALLTVSVSCSDDFVERQFNQDVEQGPLKSVQEMESFVRGTYASMRSPYYYGCDFLAYGEVRSDEMLSNLNSGYYTNVMNYTQVAADGYAKDTWNYIYQTVAKANVVINTDASSFSADDKDHAGFLQGQAYAVRALNFFDLLRVYGQQYTGSGSLGVVLPLKYDPQAKQARSTIAETEAQIASDFAKAEQLMEDHSDWDNGPSERTELSLSAVKGLMARFYLYKGNYAKVRELVDYIVDAGGYSVVGAANLQGSYTFSMNGSAANSMFELAVGNASALGTQSYRHKLSNGGYGNVVIKPAAVALFASNDTRRTLITTGSTNYLSNLNGVKGKYLNASGADNIKMLRYEEILLDGVEAELNGGNPIKALTYLNQIRTNRNLAAATSVTIAELKNERLRELLGEGLRQWDLRRWGDAVPRPTTASTSPLLNAFPIPLSETNVGAVQSNPGYDN